MKNDWKNKRVTVLGGARQGQAAARWLCRHGARVTINDHRTTGEMSAALSALADGVPGDTPITWVLGDHPIGILDTTDILCLSGGVPLDNPLVVEAVKRGIPLTNDTQIFMEIVPCKVVGITGSAGKTTTTSLVGQMAGSAMEGKAHVGGNIGDPLLNYVDDMQADDLAVLEISSFQLEQMTISPNVAAILNITPNHLDRHGTMDFYTAAKQRILEFQAKSDTAVLNREDPGSWQLTKNVHGSLFSFGFDALPEGQEGTFMKGQVLHLHQSGMDIPLIDRDKVNLLGEHNLMNFLAAFAIGCAAGLPLDAMRGAAQTFKGVPHRLEFVREWNGTKWYNDSIATAPERTMAAIRSFEEPLVLLLGGRDKDLPWEELAGLIHQRVDRVILFGEATEKIAAVLAEVESAKGGSDRSFPLAIEKCRDLQHAVIAAARLARAGDVVLLSPGGTSFDQFRDFEERGEAFRKCVSELS